MAQPNGKRLRKVRLDEVARYLECKPEKLRIALKHLAAVPSSIEYSKDAAVSINPAVRYIAPVAPTPEEAAKAAQKARMKAVLVAMMQKAVDKIMLDAADRLDQAGGKGNYSMEEVVALIEAEKAAKEEDLYQAVKPTLMRYHTMKPTDEKWLN